MHFCGCCQSTAVCADLGGQPCMRVRACVCVCCEYTLSLAPGWTLGHEATGTSHPSGCCFQLPQTRNMLALVEQGGTSLQLRQYDTTSWDQQNCDNLPTKKVFFYYRFLHFKGGSCQLIFLKAEVLSLPFNSGPIWLSEKKCLKQQWQYFIKLGLGISRNNNAVLLLGSLQSCPRSW